jgi:hypothetical protein
MKQQATETQKREAPPQPAGPPTPEEIQEQRQSLAVLETYLRMKNGITPSMDVNLKSNLLREFNLAAARVREANVAIARVSSPNCRRFTHTYEGLLAQLSFHYRQVAGQEAAVTGDLAELIKARLKILHFFERTFFEWIIRKSEAGQSELDAAEKETCTAWDRPAWSNLVFKAHARLEALHAAALGEVSALAVSDEAERLRTLSHSYQNANSGKKFAFVVTEVLASLVIWEKTLSPALRVGVGVATLTPVGRLIIVGAGAAYVAGWVYFDRTMREHVDFLRPAPEPIQRDSISTWGGTLTLAEQFLTSRLESPPLYFAYVELLSFMRKQAAWGFLRQHEELLTRVEREYGSIENAVKNTKEVLREFSKTSRRDVDAGGALYLGAG